MTRNLQVLMATLLATTTLAGASGAAELRSVRFIGMAAPKTAADMARAYSEAMVEYTWSDGRKETVPLTWHQLYTNRDRIGANAREAGRLVDAWGVGLVDPNGDPVIAETPDGTTLLDSGGLTTAGGEPVKFHVVQWEYDWVLDDGSEVEGREDWYPGMPMIANVNRLAQDPTTGRLRVESQSFVDFSEVGGLWTPCAATRTPWNTHLLGEEDYVLFDRAEVDRWVEGLTKLYFRGQKKANPYDYGYPVEIAIGPDGTTRVARHYAMGRATWEVAAVAPDGKTVYYGDDGRYTGLFMFVADRPGDLSSGTLYAAKWVQVSAENGGEAKLAWIRLGHGDDITLREAAQHERFSSTESTIFEFADGPREGFTAIQAGTKKPEYVRLRPGKEQVAPFLETRRYAALLGATTEFNKMEDVEFDPITKRVFIAMSRIDEGMTENDGGPRDDIRLPRNGAGAVYELETASGVTDTEGNPIASEWVAVRMKAIPALVGRDLPEPDALGNRADPDRIAEPDNLAVAPSIRKLFVYEDSGRHTNDFVWAYDLETGELARIASVPAGAETAGSFVVEEWNGWAYIMLNYQHQGEGLAQRKMDPKLLEELKLRIDPRIAAVGYLGPLPAFRSGVTTTASR